MANNLGDIPTLINECSKLTLNVNIKVLKRDLERSENFISWLALLTDELKKYTDVTRLNLYEKVRLLVEIRKYLPKILKLQDDLTHSITSTENITPKPQLNDSKPIKIEKNVEESNPILISEIRKLYYPSNIVKHVQSFDKCDVSTVRLRPKGDIECLLCDGKKWSANVYNTRAHVCSKMHLKKVSKEYQNLVEFHKFWERQTPETWKRHMQFNFASERLRCVVCGKSVEYVNVADHSDHSVLGKAKKYNKGPQRIIYRDVPTIKIGNDTYPTFQRLPVCTYGIRFVCLICNEHVDGRHTRERHANSVEHLRRQAAKMVRDSLVEYHKTWSRLPGDMQFRQTHFERGLHKMKCKICPDTLLDYDAECVYAHLTTVAHPNRGEIRNALKVALRDKVPDPSAGGSSNKKKNKTRAQKSQLSAESPSITTNETPHQQPANLLPISDNKKTDLNESEHEPPYKRIKIEPGTDEPTVNRVDEKFPPSYGCYGYNAPDFIPLTSNNPKVKSELDLSPIMVKTEPSYSYYDTTVVDEFYQGKN